MDSGLRSGRCGGGNTELGGFNFIMPATLVKQFVDRSGAHPKEGVFSTLYAKALDEETAGKAKAALATFTEINQMAPGHPYVQQHIAADQALVSAGKGGSESSSKTGLIAGVAGALLLLLLAGGFMILRGRKKQPAMVPVGMGGPMMSPTTVTPPLAGLPPSFATPPPPPGPSTTSPPPMAAPVAPMASSDPATGQKFCGNCGAMLTGQPFCGSCGQPAS